MAKASKGFRHGTRRKLKGDPNHKFTITTYLRQFEDSQKVIVSIDPSSQKGMPHHRFKGLVGVVKGKRGDSFIVDVKVGNKQKQIIVRPEHLTPHK